jgi:RNA polymerase sigma-70 factor (sigma-E family)
MAEGDEEFVRFVEDSSSRLIRAAFLLTGDRHRAEEATQAALVRTYARWSRVRRDDAYAYARKVMVNQTIDNWRRPIREYAIADLPEFPTGQDVAEEVARRRWVVDALSTLSARERAVIVLRFYFDLSEIEVADELNVSVGTVKSTASRGLAKLRVTGAESPTLVRKSR